LDNINSSSEIIAHWYTLIENFQTSSQQFYQAAQIAIEKRQMPDAKLCRFFWNEGGLLSAKREYLRVVRRDFHFDICGRPVRNRVLCLVVADFAASGMSRHDDGGNSGSECHCGTFCTALYPLQD